MCASLLNSTCCTVSHAFYNEKLLNLLTDRREMQRVRFVLCKLTFAKFFRSKNMKNVLFTALVLLFYFPKPRCQVWILSHLLKMTFVGRISEKTPSRLKDRLCYTCQCESLHFVHSLHIDAYWRPRDLDVGKMLLLMYSCQGCSLTLTSKFKESGL